MLIKFLRHGTGDPTKAAAYLTGTHDHNGIERAEVRVLRGNPELVGALAASLRTVHRYTSGVIAWHVDDAPTEEEIDGVLRDFEGLAFAGLEPDQYAWSAIQHVGPDGSVHIHPFAARVELRSGKAFNLAPPGWEHSFDALRDAWNHDRGWARPDDPLRSRPVQPGPLALASRSVARRNQTAIDQPPAFGIDPEEIRVPLDVEPDQKEVIADWLMRGIDAGTINNRDDVLAALAELGEINRVSPMYVSVRLRAGAKPVRLKGSLFTESFDADAIRQARQSPRHVTRNPREAPNPEAAKAARIRLEAAIERRAAYNRSRYPCASSTGDELKEAVQDVKARAAALHAQRARDAVQAVRARREHPVSETEQDGEEPHDGTGNDAAAAVQELVRGVREAVRTAGNAIERLREAALAAVRQDPGLVAIGRALGNAVERFERATRARTLRRDGELQSFDRDINLVELAEAQGYKLDKRESSRMCKIMRRGEEKILVASERNGNGIYFGLNHKDEGGSVVDFARKHIGSLGRIRKELSAWVNASMAPPPKRRSAATRAENPETVDPQRLAMLVRWHRLQPYKHGHLSEQCRLDEDLVAAWQVRQDEVGNACFPHFEEGEVCGWEEVMPGRTKFAGGRRGLALTRLGKEPVRQIVVGESAIDVASWAQLHARPPGTVYASVGGVLDRRQMEMLVKLARRHGAETILLAIGPDQTEEGMAKLIEQAVAGQIEVLCERPPGLCKNWNDALANGPEKYRGTARHSAQMRP